MKGTRKSPFPVLLIVLATVFGIALAPPAVAQRRPIVSYVPGEILVTMRSGTVSASAMTALSALGRVQQIDPRNNIFRIKLKSGISIGTGINRIKVRSDVRNAEPNYIYKVHGAPPTEGTGLYALQWAIPRTKTDLAWPLWTADTVTVLPAGGPNAPRIIAMLDTGIAFGHADLFSKIQTDSLGYLTGYNFVDNNINPWDDNGHGTHTAGIAVARVNNSIGISGIAAWDGNAGNSDFSAVKIMPVKVMDSNGFGSAANIILGIDYARTHSAHIIFLALGAEATSAPLQTAITAAQAADILIVTAAGNDTSDLQTYPAAYTGVLSVGSTDSAVGDPLSSFSNYGTWVNVAAPGSNILSTSYNGFYDYASGTSQAAALVAGEAALIRSMSPTLTQAQVFNLITKMVDPYTPYLGNSLAAGAGRVNVRDAVIGGKVGNGAGLISVTMPAVMGNGVSLTGGGTVTLANAAPAGGINVVLTWAGTDITINGGVSPQTVAVTAASSSATFDIAVVNAPGAGSVTVTATQTVAPTTLVRTATSTLTTLLNTLTVSPTTLKSGAQGLATITFNVPCPAGGVDIAVASDDTTVADTTNAGGTPITLVHFNAGDTSKTFYVTAANVSANGTCNVTATFNGDVKTVAMSVTRPAITSLTLVPSTIGVGQSSMLTVTLDGKAPTGGTAVAVTSSLTTALADPGTFTVPAGATSVTATTGATTSTMANPITTDTNITLTGTLNAATATTVLIVRPMVASVSVSPNMAKGATTPLPVGTITLVAPAPAGGLTVALTSSDTTAATVPVSVTVPAGGMSSTFTVTSLAVGADKTTVISATNQFATRTATFTSQAPSLTGLSLSPTSILVGANSTATVTIDSPAPTGGAVITLASSNTAAATVPGSVTVAAGATTATFTVTSQVILTSGNSNITATYRGVSRTASIQVTPLLAAVSVSPRLTTGATTPAPTGTVTLNQPAPAGGATITLSSSDTTAATVPASVTVAAGNSTGTFTVTTLAVSTTKVATLTATNAGISRTTTLTVAPPTVSSLTLAPTTIVGGSGSPNATATLTLGSPAPTGGLAVALSTNNPSAASPWSAATAGTAITSVTVPAGTSTTTFVVRGLVVNSDTNVSIGASFGGIMKTATVTVKPLLSSLTLAPTSVLGGVTSTGTVVLNAAAPTGGVTVTLTSSNTATATVPATLSIAAGATRGTFTATSSPVGISRTVNLSASLNGVIKIAPLTVTPPVVSNLVLAPTSVINGSATSNSVGTVTISGNAPSGGLVVNLTSSNTVVATVPSTVTVAAGATTGTFTVTSLAPAQDSSTVISATQGATKTASLTVKPLLLSVALLPTSVIGGSPSVGTVTLNAVSPAGGTVVSLASSNTGAATVPASVTVAAGSTTATFTVVSQPRAVNTPVTITATSGAANRTTSLTVQASTITSIVLNPTSLNAGESSTATVTLSGPAPVGGASITVTVANSSGSSASAPTTVTVPEGANSVTFTVSTTGFIGATRTATVSVVRTGVAGSQSATLTVRGN